MSLYELFKDILLNPRLTNYIIFAQIPIVLGLLIQSYQAYKIEIKEFRLISIAWGVNLSYLLINIILKKAALDPEYKVLIRTLFDLTSMFFFLTAVKSSFDQKPFSFLKRIPNL